MHKLFSNAKGSTKCKLHVHIKCTIKRENPSEVYLSTPKNDILQRQHDFLNWHDMLTNLNSDFLMISQHRMMYLGNRCSSYWLFIKRKKSEICIDLKLKKATFYILPRETLYANNGFCLLFIYLFFFLRLDLFLLLPWTRATTKLPQGMLPTRKVANTIICLS